MNCGELWSFIRDCMIQGQHIDMDHRDKGYEAMSARLDAAAAERADKLWAALNGQTFVSGSLVEMKAQQCEWVFDGGQYIGSCDPNKFINISPTGMPICPLLRASRNHFENRSETRRSEVIYHPIHLDTEVKL